MSGFYKIFKHLIGLVIFGTILLSTLIIENIERFPTISSKLPMRYVIITKSDINLYLLEDENRQKSPIGILKSGETVDFEAWMCPYQQIKLSDGKKYLILAKQDEVEIKLLKFYYF